MSDQRHYSHWESFGNGATVVIHFGDRSIVLQGDDAAEFVRRADTTNGTYTDADLCAEYADVVNGGAA